ncbi:aldehyde dehydrogenase family protein [Nonomuraea sp. NPDC049625]|uniref:aldehyde dehydrogenase family protein n=1 Tax=Nonomuraea sp. NPDC049625 TaxID=3155775 RepID=UPI003426ECD1
MNLPEAAPTRMLLDGQWTGGAGTFPVLNPSAGEPITHVPRASTDDVARAIDAAARAQAEWAARPPRERAEVLRRAFELTVAHQDEDALVMALEMGKTLKDAHSEETVFPGRVSRSRACRTCSAVIAGGRPRRWPRARAAASPSCVPSMMSSPPTLPGRIGRELSTGGVGSAPRRS